MAVTINSNGTITGIAAGGLPDGVVDTDTLAADAVTAAKVADNAVTTAKINADAVTAAKIADAVVNSEHLVNGGVDDAHLATGITSSKLSGALPAISGASLTGISANDNTPRFVAYAGSVSQSLTNNTWTKATWQGGVGMIDTDSAWDLTNHKFVIPSGEAGDYYFETQTSFYSSDNCLRYPNVAIYKNGSAMAWGFHGGFHTSSQAWRHGSAVMSTVETMAVGDYIEMYVRAEVFSGSISINTSSNKKFHYIMGWKLA